MRVLPTRWRRKPVVTVILCIGPLFTPSCLLKGEQTDRATRYVSQLLANCCVTVGTSRRLELERYGRRTCSKHPGRVDRRRCGQLTQPSASFVDNTVDLPWRNFLRTEFGGRHFRRKYPNFGSIPEFPCNAV